MDDNNKQRRRRAAFGWWCCCGLGSLALIGLLAVVITVPLVTRNNRSATTTTTTTTTAADTTTTAAATTITTTTTTTTTGTTTTTAIPTTTAAVTCDPNDLYLAFSDQYYTNMENLLLRNPVTNVTQYIGVMGFPGADLFVEPVTNQLYGSHQNGSGVFIFQIDKTNAATTLVCNLPQQYEAFTGAVSMRFDATGQLWMFGNNGTGYVFYTINTGTCTVTSVLINSPLSVTGTFFNDTNSNNVFYLQRAATNFLYRATVPSTPGALVGDTGIASSGGLALRLFTYCLNDVPTLEMYWQNGMDDFQFRALNPATGAPSSNGVTLVYGGNVNFWGVSPGCYCI